MLLAALTAGAISIAPAVSPICDSVGQELLAQVSSGAITNEEAAVIFRHCQMKYPRLYHP